MFLSDLFFKDISNKQYYFHVRIFSISELGNYELFQFSLIKCY